MRVGITEMAILIHHHHAKPIARLEQRLARRIVGRPPGVAARLLQLLDAPRLQAVGHRDANPGET